ncbi:Hypothetical protein A7982_09158 [Minicystis rosea]|nr:Hypothetical protein A7982_09158 [Minicystis rosea]
MAARADALHHERAASSREHGSRADRDDVVIAPAITNDSAGAVAAIGWPGVLPRS